MSDLAAELARAQARLMGDDALLALALPPDGVGADALGLGAVSHAALENRLALVAPAVEQETGLVDLLVFDVQSDRWAWSVGAGIGIGEWPVPVPGATTTLRLHTTPRSWLAGCAVDRDRWAWQMVERQRAADAGLDTRMHPWDAREPVARRCTPAQLGLPGLAEAMGRHRAWLAEPTRFDWRDRDWHGVGTVVCDTREQATELHKSWTAALRKAIKIGVAKPLQASCPMPSDNSGVAA